MAVSSVLVSFGIFVAIYAILAIGLNLKFGFTGLLDIGHVAFFLVGAYTTALLVLPPPETQQFATYILGWSLPWPVAVAAGVLMAGLFGMLVALPAIRLREDYLAITVLGISVIVKRIVQNEGWLANGPGSLRGYALPLRGFFPLPGSDVDIGTAVLFGVIVFVLWAVATYVLAWVGDLSEAPSIREKVVHALLAVTTLGTGYLGARYALRGGDDPGLRPLLATSGLTGVVAVGAALTLPGSLTALVFLGALSVFTWVFGAVALAEHYEEFTGRDYALGLGVAVAFIVTLVPIIVIGGNEALNTVGMLVTGLLLTGFLYGLYYLGDNWEEYGSTAGFVSVVGVAAVWLFVMRYFVFSLVTPFKQGGVGAVLLNLTQNVLWLLRFGDQVIFFDYARFLLVLSLAALAVVYYLAEVTVNSPYGRALKAVRDDEDVATALGKNAFAFKVQSMILGSAIAGLAGALWAIFAGSLVHTMFAPRITFVVFLMVIIGGTANNRGVILGAIIYWAFQSSTATIKGFLPTAMSSSIAALRLAFIGALLIIILYYRPEGLLGEEHTGGGEQ